MIIALLALTFFNIGEQSNGIAISTKPPIQYNLTKELIAHSKEQAAKRLAQAQKIRLAKVIEYMKTRVYQTPYIFSGSSISGWDCSGMVKYAYKRIGINLPHSANAQGHLGKRVSKPAIGDIVAMAQPNQTHFEHTMIYIGDGLVLEANRFYNATIIQPLANYQSKQIRFIRIIDAT